jgi:hypothetical protein
MGKQHLIPVQVLEDLSDVLLLLRPLVADESAGLVPRDPRDVGNLPHLLRCQREDIKGDGWMLFYA